MTEISVTDIKRQLEENDMSTTTPGITGEERYAELSMRLKMFDDAKDAKVEAVNSRTRQKIHDAREQDTPLTPLRTSIHDAREQDTSPSQPEGNSQILDDEENGMFRYDVGVNMDDGDNDDGDDDISVNSGNEDTDISQEQGHPVPTDRELPSNIEANTHVITDNANEIKGPLKAKISSFNRKLTEEDPLVIEAYIRELRGQARQLEGLGDLVAAEWAHQEALQIDPLDIRTLTLFAVFLHRKKGELGRAEAFFGRGLQLCVPNLFNAISCKSKRKIRSLSDMLAVDQDAASKDAAALAHGDKNEIKSNNDQDLNVLESIISNKSKNGEVLNTTPNRGPGSDPSGDPETGSRIKTKDVITLLLKFAGFLTRSQGDIESADQVYRKAVEIDPLNPMVLASAAHFISREDSGQEEALLLYARALKVNPSNALYTLWYAKLLRKKGKIPQAEVMYQVAIKHASKMKVSEYTISNNSVEASAICNYATFIYKQKKNPQKALNLFENGLKKFVSHKGLTNNYVHLLKDNSNLVGDPEVLVVLNSKLRNKISFRVMK
mmetsp:Transcript_4543/g.4684  ORF Transcript_4543/g.4684 Transcript_4543/m.4684 type:complete len:551 (+) Transcript_4543:139-1791(+)